MARLTTFRDLRAVVTGASSGIGQALARRLGREGARLALVARREEALQQLKGEIEAGGGSAEVFAADLADREQAVAAARSAEAQLGGVDLLVNNAGFGGRRRFVECELDAMDRMLRVNYTAALAMAHTLLPGMLERRRGWLVFMSSVAGKIPTPLEAPYAASKAALLALAEAVSLEVEGDGVHVLTVCPGVIETPFFSEADWKQMPAVARRGAVPVDSLVDRIVHALARGRHELTHPGPIAFAYRVKALAPGFMRRQVKRTTLG